MAGAAHAAAGRKAASVPGGVRMEAGKRICVYGACPRGSRGARSGGGWRGSPKLGSGGFQDGGEKVLANSTCGVFVGPAEAPAAEITTWGRGGKRCRAPSPLRGSLPLGSGTAGTQTDGPPRGLPRPFWDQGCSWARWQPRVGFWDSAKGSGSCVNITMLQREQGCQAFLRHVVMLDATGLRS